MKLVFFQFPLAPAWGGAEDHTLLLAKQLAVNGHQVRLYSNNQALHQSFREAGFPSTCLFLGWEPTTWWSLLIFPFTFFWAVFFFLFIILRQLPNGIFCLSLSDKLTATWIAKLFGVKRVIWNEHTRIGRWLSSNPLLPFYLLASRWARVVAPSFFLRNQLVMVGVRYDDITVIYPACSLTVDTDPGQKDDLVIFGFLGRLAKEKGVDDLLIAASKLKNPPVIKIAGTGPEESFLKHLTKKLGLNSRVTFAGHIKNRKEFFSHISVLVVPSKLPESFGLSALEAMSFGVPVIAGRTGGLTEIIEHKKTGLLYQPGNTEQLKEAMQFLADEPGMRSLLSDRARRTASLRFSQYKMGQAFLRLLS